LQGTSSGTAVYVETQTPTTNTNGLVSLEIGAGAGVSGNFTTIDWANGPYFIKTETDPTGGTSYSITGISQLLSVPYALHADNVSGLEKITESTKTGRRLIGINPANYGNIGTDAVDLSISGSPTTTRGATGNISTAMGWGTTAFGFASTAMGNQTTASGDFSTATGADTMASGLRSTSMGSQTTASGDKSTAMGELTVASGNASTAMGYFNLASGLRSTAMGANGGATGNTSTSMGEFTVASGDYSTAMGNQTKAEAVTSTVVGRYNLGGGNPTAWVGTDPLFEIGNGTSTTPSNALTVLKNGNTDISGVLRVNGLASTTESSGVEIDFSPHTFTSLFSVPAKGTIRIIDGVTEFAELRIDASMLVPNTNNSTDLGSSALKWKKVYAVNGTIQTSDRRMKKDINDIHYGLNSLMQLRPVSYKWKQGDQGLKLGLIAQEVQKVLPEVVDVGTDENKTLGMNYSELIPVLIKAIQELKVENDALKAENSTMKTANSTMKAETQSKIEALVSRLNSLESSLNQ